jgi:hypothetical protein
LKVFKTKWFDRFSRKNGIDDRSLREAIERAENGLIDADLGGGVIKQRIARKGQGRSGGYRTIILFKQGNRSFFVYGFAKSDQENIEKSDEECFKELAINLLNISESYLAELIAKGDFMEVCNEQEI